MTGPARPARALAMLLPLLACRYGSHAATVAEPAAGPNPATVAGTATALTVGPGRGFSLPSEAARAAKPGDIIRIFPGRYVDCAIWDADGLVIEGVGAGVVIADKVCNNKGIFITTGQDITIRNITFTAAHATAHNGSGIRAE